MDNWMTDAAGSEAVLRLARFAAFIIDGRFIGGDGFRSIAGDALDDEAQAAGILDGDLCLVLDPDVAAIVARFVAQDSEGVARGA